MKKKFSILFGFIVGVFFMYLAFREIDYGKLAGLYSRVNPFYLIPCFAIIFLELFARGVKWNFLLRPAGKISVWDCFRFETIGLALNNILPLRLGEIVRAFWASNSSGIPVVTVFSTIFIERVLDAILISILFALAIKLDSSTGVVSAVGNYSMPAVYLMVFGLVCLAFIDEIVSHKWLNGRLKKFPRVYRTIREIGLGVKCFHRPGTAFGVVLAGLGQWLLDALNIYLIAAAFGLSSAVNFYKSVILLFAGAVAASIPSMPGFFGNYEYSLTKVMALWGIDGSRAFAFASYLHLAFYIIVTLTGLFFMYQMGWSVKRVWKKFRHASR